MLADFSGVIWRDDREFSIPGPQLQGTRGTLDLVWKHLGGYFFCSYSLL
jgi:hypothetical protein